MVDPWTFISTHLNRTVTLMVVVHDQGSAPGKRGFKMVVVDPQTTLGTVGGGIMEFNLVAQASAANATGCPQSPRLLERVHRRNAPQDQQSGMICAGSQTIAVITLTSADRPLVDRLCSESGRLRITANGLTLDEQPITSPQFEPGEDWSYTEPHRRPDIVYVVGGGHVGAAVCRAMSLLNFRVVVFDHRPELAVFQAIDTDCEKIVCDYNQIDQHMESGPHVYVVIVTTGFDSDARALVQTAGMDLRYLGLMGSAAKLSAIFKYAREHGVTQAQLDQIHAPIGLSIKNRTPMEIAFSIAGQIIDIRNS